MSLDPSIYGPFPRATFLNGTVYNFTATVGWGTQSTLVNLDIVNDPLEQNDYQAVYGTQAWDGGTLIGSPCTFSYSGFQFTGLLKSSDQVNDFNGNPVFKA